MRRRSLRSGSALLAILLAGVSLLLAAPAASAEPGSTANDVATASSTTAVRCAFRTYNLPTDWYLPSPAAPPVGLLYAQHGFAESRADFSEFATAAAAAGFVVFVPTLPTADLFGCTVQNLGNNTRFLSNVASLFATAGDPLGALSTSYAAAVAKIGRPAPPLPTALTIIGHSAGGEAALYIAQQLTAPNHGTADLRGIVLADPVRSVIGDSTVSSLQALAGASMPIQVLAAPPYSCNANQSGTRAVLRELAGRGFVGAQLTTGSHADILGGSVNKVERLTCGTPRKINVETTRTLAIGWLTAAATRAGPDQDLTPGGASYDALVANGVISTLIS